MPQRRLTLYRAAVAAAALYFVAGWVLALWFPADGLDLYVSYVAGTASLDHASPYVREAYRAAWDGLETPRSLGSTREFPFGYPPAWVPVCMLLSLLPWGVALAAWKALNVLFLVGTVLLTFRLLRADDLDVVDRYAVWCFALTLSPTISVLTVGQTSLLVLFLLLVAGCALQRGHAVVSGLALALSLVKPQMAAPFALFLVFRGELVVLGVAAAGATTLTALGLYLSNSDPGVYVTAVQHYARLNGPTSHVAVGVASLLVHAQALRTAGATAIGVLIGIATTAGLAFHPNWKDARARMPDVLPVLLYLAPLSFRCNAYDLVALIPLFAWSRGRRAPRAIRLSIQALGVLLIVPRAALRIGYDRLAAGVLARDTYQVAEFSVRSVVLVLLLPLVLCALYARTTGGQGASTQATGARDA